MFGRRKKATIHVPSLEIPSVELGGGRLPTIRTPELRTPEVELPRVEIPRVEIPRVEIPRIEVPRIEVPSVALGGLRLPQIETPTIQTPRLDFELMAQPPFVRRRRTSPILRALMFVVGIGLGLAVGGLIAALLAPATGEETRRRLRELVGGLAPAGGSRGGDETSTLPAATGAVRDGVAGLISNPKGRFQVALEEARKEREAKERELRAEFETAKRTGEKPN
jgi:gas vesicle protein